MSDRLLPGTRREARWIWALLSEGRWEEAAAVVRSLKTPAKSRVWPAAEVWLGQAKDFADGTYLPQSVLADVLADHVLGPMASRSTPPTVERSLLLARETPFILSTLKDIDRRDLNAGQQQALLMLEHGETGRLPHPTPRLRLQDVVLTDGEVHFFVGIATEHERLTGLRLARADELHEIPVSLKKGSTVHGSLPVAELSYEPLKLYGVVETPYGPVEYNLGVTSATTVSPAQEDLLLGTAARELQRVPAQSDDGTVTRRDLISRCEGISVKRVEVADEELRISLHVRDGVKITDLRAWRRGREVIFTRTFALGPVINSLQLGTLPRKDLIFQPRLLLATVETPEGCFEIPVAVPEEAVVNTNPNYQIQAPDGLRLGVGETTTKK